MNKFQFEISSWNFTKFHEISFWPVKFHQRKNQISETATSFSWIPTGSTIHIQFAFPISQTEIYLYVSAISICFSLTKFHTWKWNFMKFREISWNFASRNVLKSDQKCGMKVFGNHHSLCSSSQLVESPVTCIHNTKLRSSHLSKWNFIFLREISVRAKWNFTKFHKKNFASSKKQAIQIMKRHDPFS